MPENKTASPRQTEPLTKAGAIVAAVLAAFYGLMITIISTFGIISALSAQAITVPQPVSVPISATSTGAIQLLEGSYQHAVITVTGAGGGIRALLASSIALDTLMHVAVAFGVVMLSVALLRGRPFRRAMIRTLIVICFALVIAGTVSTGLLGFANMEIADGLGQPGFPMLAHLDFTPSIVGVVIALVAAAFQYGEHLQRDTEGLI